jgi:arsenite-transporting ATPase
LGQGRGTLGDAADAPAGSADNAHRAGTLPETTPVMDAAWLQDDLRRAHRAQVDRSLAASGTKGPVPAARLVDGGVQLRPVMAGSAQRNEVVP